ncbi:MAG: hypothetical protein NC102_02430 [Clostridium sp.]|nr:hypothetical protein [Clostridium sp.]
MSTVRMVMADEYYQAFPESRTPYGTRAFIEVNAGRAEAVRHFVSYDEKDAPRLGIILGYRDGKWVAPFSAPFAEIAYRKAQSLERIYDFISELADTLQGAPLEITLPPAFYDPQALPAMHGVLGNFARKTVWDYNYHLPVGRGDEFISSLSRQGRKNYNQAKRQGFVFEKTDDMARAYAVISANREAHGYPLAMSLERIRQTVAPGPGGVCADFFVMSLEGEDVAAAMAYRINGEIAQVIYWGDAPGHSEKRPMNILPEFLLGYYREIGVKTLDIGPASTHGIPNEGLCRFKESIGCRLTLKPTFLI